MKAIFTKRIINVITWEVERVYRYLKQTSRIQLLRCAWISDGFSGEEGYGGKLPPLPLGCSKKGEKGIK